MSLWIKLDVHLPDHPKIIELRVLTGTKADSAELGWYRLLMAAKRYGRWTFVSETHLRHVLGRYFAFVPAYRQVGLLDDLTVHDGDEYNAPKSDAERQREKRARDKSHAAPVTPPVTTVTPREEKSREERAEQKSDDRDALDTYHELTMWRPWGSWSGEKLRGLIASHGNEAVDAALRESFAKAATRDTLLDRAIAVLERNAERAKRDAEKRHKAELRAMEITPEQAAENQRRINAEVAKMTGKPAA
jgi:hypothetical protein